jgi:Holliday junction DNA helicase RuvA
MFAYLRGKVHDIIDQSVILDVNGVGYELYCSSKTQQKIGEIGDEASLSVITHVREDHIHLYGFADAHEKQWFNILTAVQGVGAKVGLAILSALTTDEIHQSIMAQDKAMVSRADGVGPKLAARIVNELKDKVGKLALGGISQGAVKNFVPNQSLAAHASLYQDVVSALANLGYKRFDVDQVVRAVMADLQGEENIQVVLKHCLQKLSGNKIGGAA